MAAKVTTLFKKDTVQTTLCEVADMGLTELVLIGKKPDGGLVVRYSPCECIFAYLGALDVLKDDLLSQTRRN